MNKLIDLYQYVDILREQGLENQANNLKKDLDKIIKNQPINNIIKWQKDRLLDKQEFSNMNESTNIIEEVLEMNGVKINKETRELFKESISTLIEKYKFMANRNIIKGITYEEPTEEDKVDALFDICVFAIGGMLKLGYDPECVFKEGIKHINSRSGSIIDGKFQKDANIKTYEPEYNRCKVKK